MLSKQKNIYISGFMGTGKSTTGSLLALRLGVPFIDSDELIEIQCGMSIRNLFANKGEPFFRRQESQLLLQLQNRTPAVISLGGGAILSEPNRKILKQGYWINLRASSSWIMKRLEEQTNRPLLGTKPKRASVDELLRKRMPFYNLAPFQIDTDGLSSKAVAEKIFNLIDHKLL